MVFICNSCGEKRDFESEYGILVITPDKDFYRYCRYCRSPQASFPDVYWDGKEEHGLADDPETGKPRVFLSRGQKAAYLRDRGIVEAGDRVNGAPPNIMDGNKKRDSRPEVKRALAEVKKMGKEYRRALMRRINYERQANA